MKVVGLVLVELLALAGWCGTAHASVPCAVHGHVVAGVAHSRVVSVSRDVVVYRVRHEQEEVRLDTLWVCDRKNNRAVRIGNDEWVSVENIGGQVANRTLEHLQIAGTWVLATQTGDEDQQACFKYEVSSCDGPSSTLVVANAALGLAGSLASIRDYVVELNGERKYVTTAKRTWSRTLLSLQGAVAWLEESGSGSVKTTSLFGCLAHAVHGKIGCSARTHAEGDIEPDSVRLSHTTLTWMVGGSAQAAVL